MAQGVVDAYKNMGDAINVPIIVRLQGTNADIAKELIDNSGLDVQSAVEFQKEAMIKFKLYFLDNHKVIKIEIQYFKYWILYVINYSVIRETFSSKGGEVLRLQPLQLFLICFDLVSKLGSHHKV